MSQPPLPETVSLPTAEETTAPCPACGSAPSEILYRLRGIPVHSNVLLQSRDAARAYPRGDLDLAHCRRCGFLFNPLFETARADYGPGYEETQGFSATFRRFLSELTTQLGARYALANALVIEIGCGKGEFLTELCQRTGARGLGFDPTLDEKRVQAAPGIELRAERYGAGASSLSASLLCCRHTLEHIPAVGEFIAMLRKNLAQAPAPVFFEVPDTLRELEEGAFWDIYYEHCSYFTAGSLARLFRSHGFAVESLELAYGGQYILLHARSGAAQSQPTWALEQDLERIAAGVEHFKESVSASLGRWHEFLSRARAQRKAVVLWGSGSKGVGFLTTLGPESGIEYVVDINPHKQGRFMAGSGQQIVPPDFLREHAPAHVIIMNPVYKQEITAELQQLGVQCQVHVL